MKNFLYAILLIAAAAAAFMLVFSMVMFVVHRKEN